MLRPACASLRRETSDSSEESGSDSSKVSNHDNLNMSQNKWYVKGGKEIAKIGVAKGSSYSHCILSDSSSK